MDMLYLGFKELQVVFYAVAIVYLVKNWNR